MIVFFVYKEPLDFRYCDDCDFFKTIEEAKLELAKMSSDSKFKIFKMTIEEI